MKSTTGKFATSRFRPFTWKTSSVGKGKVNNENFVNWKLRPFLLLQSWFNAFIHLKSQRQRTLRLLFEDCRFIYFHSLMKSAFLPSKGLFCLYDKQNNTWLLVDMEFLFSCSTHHLTRSLRSISIEEKFHIYARPCIILYITRATFEKQLTALHVVRISIFLSGMCLFWQKCRPRPKLFVRLDIFSMFVDHIM